jgi:hypothetical protein
MSVAKYVGRFVMIAAGSLTIGALVSLPKESQAGVCPYDGDYVACLEAGETVDFCKAHVLNCVNDEEDEPMEPESGSCEWLVDESLGDECPFSPSYVHIGLPLDITSNSGRCPYDSYVECLLSAEHHQDVAWCKAHQLNCVPQLPSVTLVVPIEAKCGLFGINGTILFEGTTEIVGSNYCVHVTSFDYTGGRSGTVDAAINAELAQSNSDCGGDTHCVCMPRSCL